MLIKKKSKKKNDENYSDYAYAASAKNENFADKKVPFAVVEAYKIMRTNLMFLLAKNNGKIISFTSSNASEGKSTTSINMAIAFSQLGGKVLVVDADLRRSSIHKKLHLENENGLSNVLAGFVKLDDAVQAANPNLDVLTAGPIPPNPSELLGSQLFADLMKTVRDRYDYVIIDTPPLNIVTDAMIIAPNTDGVVMVVRDAYTPHESIKAAINSAKFANIKFLGAIINGANPKNSRRYTYRRYSYKYGYNKYGYSRGYYGRGHKGHGYGYGYGYSRSNKPYEKYE